jgi:hypothetical protein
MVGHHLVLTLKDKERWDMGAGSLQNAFLLRFKRLAENGCNDDSINSYIIFIGIVFSVEVTRDVMVLKVSSGCYLVALGPRESFSLHMCHIKVLIACLGRLHKII